MLKEGLNTKIFVSEATITQQLFTSFIKNRSNVNLFLIAMHTLLLGNRTILSGKGIGGGGTDTTPKHC